MASLEEVDEIYPVLIVGGGIVGAGIFRDLALHKLPCLLIDKKDFSSQTSQASSKMLHGGIRYLESMDFKLVWEASHEKNLWPTLAPHLCKIKAFYLPIYNDSIRPLWKIRCGLFLYDLLSGFENTFHSLVSPRQTLEDIPGLRKDGLKGTGVYYDAIMDDAKLTLEVIYDGMIRSESSALNYVSLVKLQKEGKNYVALLRDELTGQEKQIRAKAIVMAVGPFTDQLMQELAISEWRPKLLPTKGSHLWIDRKRFPISHPVLLTPKDKRVIFVIPHGDRVLVGTTEVKPRGDYFGVRPEQEEVDYLINSVNEFFPTFSIRQEDILGTFAGIRPLVKDESSTHNRTIARIHKVCRPDSNFYVIIGGKYTTFRTMGQSISRELCLQNNIAYNSNLSKSSLYCPEKVIKSDLTDLTHDHIRSILETGTVRTLEDLIQRRLGLPHYKFWKRDDISFRDFFTPLLPELDRRLQNVDLQAFLDPQ